MPKGVINVYAGQDTRQIHVETHMGIVNIFLGLQDEYGHPVENVQVHADRMAGELPVGIDAPGDHGDEFRAMRLIRAVEE